MPRAMLFRVRLEIRVLRYPVHGNRRVPMIIVRQMARAHMWLRSVVPATQPAAVRVARSSIMMCHALPILRAIPTARARPCRLCAGPRCPLARRRAILAYIALRTSRRRLRTSLAARSTRPVPMALHRVARHCRYTTARRALQRSSRRLLLPTAVPCSRSAAHLRSPIALLPEFWATQQPLRMSISRPYRPWYRPAPTCSMVVCWPTTM